MTIPVIEDHPQMWELPNRILCDVMMPVLDLIVGTPPPTPDAFVDFGGWLLTSSLGF